MGAEYRAKVFKSGNSVAIRIPKAWGFRPGEVLDVVARDDGSYEVRRPQEESLSLDDLFGSFSPDFMAGGREATNQDERDWSVRDDLDRGA